MVLNVFNRAMPWATQGELVNLFIAKLKATPMAELSTSDYSSSLVLSGHLLAADEDKLICIIEVYQSFVRIIRNEKGQLPLGAVIMDYVRNPKSYQDEFFRP